MDQFERLNEILDGIFRDNCECTNKECMIMDVKLPYFNNKVMNKTNFCNIIVRPLENPSNEDFLNKQVKLKRSNDMYLKSSIRFLVLLRSWKLIILSDVSKYGKYKLWNGKFLSWKNLKEITLEEIKLLDKEFVLRIYNFFTGIKTDVFESRLYSIVVYCIKVLFWYFRKSMVDNILKDIIYEYNLDVLCMSVGSTRLESDYDITMYGDYDHIAFCIQTFTNTINDIFSTSSSELFDTNLYGAGFIEFDTKQYSISSPIKKSMFVKRRHFLNKWKDSHVCDKKTFKYIKEEFIMSDYQHVWLFMKYIKYTNSGVFKMMNEFSELDERYTEHVKHAERLYSLIKIYKDNTNYVELVHILSDIQENMEFDQNFATFINLISLISFSGSETYFTRGAFLDVVINQQMCGEMQTGVKLNESSIIDSVLENMFDFLINRKEKYLKRSLNGLLRLTKMNSVYDIFYHQFKKVTDIIMFQSSMDQESLVTKQAIMIWQMYIDNKSDTLSVNWSEMYKFTELLSKPMTNQIEHVIGQSRKRVTSLIKQ